VGEVGEGLADRAVDEKTAPAVETTEVPGPEAVSEIEKDSTKEVEEKDA